MSPARQRPDHAVRDDVEDEIDRFLRFRLLDETGDRRRIGLGGKPVPDLEQIAHDEAEHQRERRHNLEIDQRLDADAADLAGILDV